MKWVNGQYIELTPEERGELEQRRREAEAEMQREAKRLVRERQRLARIEAFRAKPRRQITLDDLVDVVLAILNEEGQ